MFHSTFKPGDRVVFEMEKHSTSPGPRASSIKPEPHGEGYYYRVDKYWIVKEVRNDGTVVLETRRGKRHVLPADHHGLRHANWRERLFLADRFPEPREESRSASGS